MLGVTFHVPEAAIDRFRLMYPKRGALRVLLNTAIRAAIDRPDLCQFLTRTYGPDAFTTRGTAQHPKLEHPLRTIRSDPYVLRLDPPAPEDRHGDDDPATPDAD